jgi:paraquat-inducible protein B
MSKQANPTVIGGFVLGALALVVVGVLVFSSGVWMRERVPMVTHFETTVQGLTVGSQVLFQGVPVGQVTNIGIDYVSTRERFRIPVSYEIWPKQVHVLGEVQGLGVRELLRLLVADRGLRAKLESVSFVTGQYVITLALDPSAPRLEPQAGKGPVEVPPTPATRDQLEEIFQNVDVEDIAASVTGTLNALETLLRSPEVKSALTGLDGSLNEANATLAQLNTGLQPMLGDVRETLRAYRELAQTLNARIDPLADQLEQRIDTVTTDISALAGGLDARVGPVTSAATEALNEVGGAMRAIAELAGDGSSTRYELSQLLTEATRAAQSLRSLADYLERHPEALIQGKR